MSSPGLNLRYQAHLRTPSPDPDAGLRGVSHYERRLPPWRYRLRQWLIPVVRWETPYLARMQHAMRSPLLDSYFALTANLGTHTFFMTALPICFWCGYAELGIALVQMLAAGVYLSGYAKDLVCLPRPLSPPLQRITMSGSAALEYGFPSTHTTNAVSVAVYCLHSLWASQDDYSTWHYRALVAACLCYATSISIGRMYCGMHGFFDVLFGAILGVLITAVRVFAGPAFDSWVISGGWMRPLISIAVLGLGVRFHPEPADNCPCFDDSVAFIGVVMGICIGTWNYAQLMTGLSRPDIAIADLYVTSNSDIAKVAGRLVVGIVMIFIWRSTAKRTLLKTLPPIFRFVGAFGLRIPRRYFLQSRDYNTVPTLRKDDKVLPPARDIPGMLSTFTRRKRTISIGPQSEADAREFIANREQTRRDERSSSADRSKPSKNHQAMPTSEGQPNATTHLSVRPNVKIQSFSGARDVLTPPASENDTATSSEDGADDRNESRRDERLDREMFSALEKPRIRYDVEVITKIIVYAGIAWLAVEGNPILFGKVGIF
ncbi:related to sphingoid base-phosphate phosphatase [Ramularia collo-cygni]|uniref:Related to sphingoid base-phosphate phosphatase n=1 Tax=Ramularia collo-cygni TaxID=112498 RepID=A0A2D3VMG3_9PEZI|nr:related to sphingoid base-phosphate phosphatase [Ramularia collo-cygni]CZT25019.1 related to sphingoid base-phosphate phosphatase [Ramularia collo-cygni]